MHSFKYKLKEYPTLHPWQTLAVQFRHPCCEQEFFIIHILELESRVWLSSHFVQVIWFSQVEQVDWQHRSYGAHTSHV